MLRYEQDMDKMRALVPPILEGMCLSNYTSCQTQEHIFLFIQHFMHVFAQDIRRYNSISSETLDRFRSAVYSLQQLFGIGEKELQDAHDMQLYTTSGFWEMRRFLGQFPEFAEQACEDGVDTLLGIGMSGCIIAEMLGIEMAVLKPDVQVGHIVFARDAKGIPNRGIISPNISWSDASHILFVDDAVLTATTIQVSLSSLPSEKQSSCSFFALEHAKTSEVNQALSYFVHVYEPIL